MEGLLGNVALITMVKNTFMRKFLGLLGGTGWKH